MVSFLKREPMYSLYLVSNPYYSYEFIESFLDNRIEYFQLRLKGVSDEEFLNEASRYKELCAKRGVKFIINDNLKVAKEIGADGLHIGQEDLDFQYCRENFEGFIGVSCHNKDEAKEAFEMGVDYIGYGAIYPTQTKSDAKVVGLESLREVASMKMGKIAAIGGIDQSNYRDVVDAKADILALSSVILGSDNPKETIGFLGAL